MCDACNKTLSECCSLKFTCTCTFAEEDGRPVMCNMRHCGNSGTPWHIMTGHSDRPATSSCNSAVLNSNKSLFRLSLSSNGRSEATLLDTQQQRWCRTCLRSDPTKGNIQSRKGACVECMSRQSRTKSPSPLQTPLPRQLKGCLTPMQCSI